MASWIEDELAGCKFADVRLEKRFRTLVERLSEGIGETITMACQDWANTKAAYRFLSNSRVDEEDILAGHFQSTRDRFRSTDGLILVLHDTTEFSFRREQPELIGNIKLIAGRKDRSGKPHLHMTCGILMHSSLVVTREGLPLGISAAKFWTRKEFKGTNALKKKINPTRVPIEEKESVRWLDNIKQTTTLLGDPELQLTVIYAQERETPSGRDPIDWKLITDLPVSTPLQAIEKLEWYASRWKIETFHKILKSGCKAEESKLRTADRLVNLIAMFCILSWRIFWMTMLNRSTSGAPTSIAFTDTQ